ncbi:MAG TPA: MurT ligase domain-containing protein [Ktedonobacteraceae bacterium]|nr:MurT ligase domain-containing protein [Ktedonobacteraceae bacterium]
MPKQKSPRLVSREKRSGKSKRRQTQTDKTFDGKNLSHTISSRDGARRSSQRTSLRAGFAVMGGRTMGALSRRLHLGGGTSVVGIVAQRLYPDIVGHLASQLEHGSIIVTGTNGKTTTSGLIAAILSDAGLRVWRNREGSNLMRGVASSLVIRALPNGNLRRSGAAISIFEVDEAVVPQMVVTAPPRVAVFTNLFRDQLDRYGEVDSIATRWLQAVKALPNDTTLVLNADDPTTAHLGELFSGKVLYFGIDDPALDLKFQQPSSERHQVIDSRTCPKCGNEYTYELRFYSHMGHYVCTNCGHKRPQADIRVTKVLSDDFDRLRIHVESEKQEGDIVIPLPGLYNIYNALAAITTSQVLDIDWEPVVTGIEQFKPMFGRGERVQIEGRTLRLLLAKNPTGFNEVLRTLFNEETARHVLFVLNDNSADGRDISWIWDVDFERVVKHTTTLVVGGTRALDLALRLKYAGIAQEEMTIVPATLLRASRREKVAHNRISRDAKNMHADTEIIVQGAEGKPVRRYGIAEAINSAVRQTPPGETLFVVPTYTGLLEIHRELEQRGLTPHYWEGRDE